MNEVTVSALFEAFLRAEAARERGGGSYGQALAAAVTLLEIFRGCHAKVELPKKVLGLVVPFLSSPPA